MFNHGVVNAETVQREVSPGCKNIKRESKQLDVI